jgi:hypothetical protein
MGLDVEKVLRDGEIVDEAAVGEDSIDRESLKQGVLSMATSLMLPDLVKEGS